MYDSEQNSTQGLEVQLQDPSHLFRHASEITKGRSYFKIYIKIYIYIYIFCYIFILRIFHEFYIYCLFYRD